MDWTKKDLKLAQKILERSTSVAAAGAEIARQTGHSGDSSSLRASFRRHGLKDPREYLAAPEAPVAPVEDPLERRRRETNDARIKREHAELVQRLGASEEREALRDALAACPLKPIRRREIGSDLREGTACALLSDIHVEEKVLPGDTPTGNAYTLEIAEHRLGRFFTSFEWLIKANRPTFQLRDVVLWLGGDLMTGQIHPENIETGALSPIQTTLWLYPRLYAGIKQILADQKIERLSLICSYGNHGRNTIKPYRARGAAHSYEWGMYSQLASALKAEFGDRIDVLADPSGHQYLQVYDFDTHWHHGDETNYQGGVGGIMIPINKAVAAWDKVRRCHFHNFGHWHTYLQTRNVTMNGSGIGYSAYSMAIKADPEPAQQAFYVIDSKRGKTAKSPIWLEDREGENVIRAKLGMVPWPSLA